MSEETTRPSEDARTAAARAAASDATAITWAGEVDDADTTSAGTPHDASAVTWAGEVDDAGTTATREPSGP